jgi:hypothetical protein
MNTMLKESDTLKVAVSEVGLVTAHGGLSCLKIQYLEFISVFTLPEFRKFREVLASIWYDRNLEPTAYTLPGLTMSKAGFYEFKHLEASMLEDLLELVEDADAWITMNQQVYEQEIILKKI